VRDGFTRRSEDQNWTQWHLLSRCKLSAVAVRIPARMWFRLPSPLKENQPSLCDVFMRFVVRLAVRNGAAKPGPRVPNTALSVCFGVLWCGPECFSVLRYLGALSPALTVESGPSPLNYAEGFPCDPSVSACIVGAVGGANQHRTMKGRRNPAGECQTRAFAL
jgi:hypothetical protein